MKYQSAHKLFHKQWQFVNSEARYTLYSGAVGAGKTLALCYRALKLAKPNTIGLLGAWDYPMISDIIMPTMLEILQAFPKHRYRWQTQIGNIKNLYVLSKAGDSEIRIRNLEREEKVRGTNLSWYCIDEVTSGIKEDVFIQLTARLRVGEKQYANFATNPGPKAHYIYDFFYNCTDEEKKGRKIIHAKTIDNIHNPKSYYKDLSTRPASWRKRFLEGEWGAFEGMVYDNFSHENNIKEFDTNSSWDFYLAVDHGIKNPFACLLCGVENNERVYIIDELYQSGILAHQRCDLIKKDLLPRNNMNEDSIDTVVSDYAPLSDFRALRESLDIHVQMALKDRMTGIQKVKRWFELRKDGRSGIIIHPRCKNTIKELETYAWLETSDRSSREDTIKANDHTCDALRYLIATLFRE